MFNCIRYRVNSRTAGLLLAMWISSGGVFNAHAAGDLSQVLDYSFASIIDVTPLNGRAIALVRTGNTSGEIYITDGTTAGTQAIGQITMGAGTGAFSAGNHVFIATRFLGPSGKGPQLYVTDGTAAGTKLIGGDIQTYVSYLFQKGLRIGKDSTLFTAQSSRLSRTDADAGTNNEIRNFGSGTLQYLTLLGDQLLFVRDLSDARELWRSDGTDRGTVLVKRIDAPCSTPLTVVDNAIYLLCAGQVWRSDGSPAGTRVVSDLPTAASNAQPIGGAGKRFFYWLEDATTRTLWTSDGTAPGTQAVGVLEVDAVPSAYHALGDTLVFSSGTTSTPTELWRSDGTAAGTAKISDFVSIDSRVGFTEFQSQLYYSAEDAAMGTQLWATDGTAAGTRRITDAEPGVASLSPTEITVVNNRLIFTPGTIRQFELWQSDGTQSGTSVFKAIRAETAGMSPSELTQVGDRLYFDGACNLPFVLADPLSTPSTTGPNNCGRFDRYSDDGRINSSSSLTAHQDALYFTATRIYSFGSEYNLWRSDLSETTQFRSSSRVGHKTSIGDSLYMNEKQGRGFGLPGDEPAVIDANGFRKLAIINCNADFRGSLARLFTALNETTVLFAATEYYKRGDDNRCLLNGGMLVPGRGRELWRTDGTEAGTVLVKDIHPGGSSTPANFMRFGTLMIFAADDGVNGQALWQSDGSEAGTVIMADINPNGDTQFGEFIRFGSLIVFAADAGTGRMDLWRSDGTAAGTLRITSGLPANPESLAVFNGKLYFSAQDPADDRELWVSDGTAAGTQRVTDINPGSSSANPTELTALNEELLFVADDGVHGKELWSSDGSAAGTQMVADLRAGSESSEPSDLNVFRDHLFMAADDGVSGRELWRYTPADDNNDALQFSQTATPNAFSALGDQITLEYAVNNTGNTVLTNLRVTDSEIGIVCTIGSLWPGISTTCTGVYFVDNSDIARGNIVFDATLLGDGGVAASDTVTVAGTSTPLIEISAASVPVAFASLYEPLTLTINIRNLHTQALTNITVTEPRIGHVCTSDSLWPGVTVNCTAVYFISANDIASGKVAFDFEVKHDQSAGVARQSLVVNSRTPVNVLAISAASVPQSFTGAGEQLTVTVRVANVGDAEQTNIRVDNASLGEPLCRVSSLWPTNEAICTGVYFVTPNDVASGSINFFISADSDQISTPRSTTLSVGVVAN